MSAQPRGFDVACSISPPDLIRMTEHSKLPVSGEFASLYIEEEVEEESSALVYLSPKKARILADWLDAFATKNGVPRA